MRNSSFCLQKTAKHRELRGSAVISNLMAQQAQDPSVP